MSCHVYNVKRMCITHNKQLSIRAFNLISETMYLPEIYYGGKGDQPQNFSVNYIFEAPGKYSEDFETPLAHRKYRQTRIVGVGLNFTFIPYHIHNKFLQFGF